MTWPSGIVGFILPAAVLGLLGAWAVDRAWKMLLERSRATLAVALLEKTDA